MMGQFGIPNLFEKFNGRDFNPNSIGLGLYICKKVVELCGGEIYISRSIQKVDDPINHGT